MEPADDDYVVVNVEEDSSTEDRMEPSDDDSYVMANAEEDSSAEDVCQGNDDDEEDSSVEEILQGNDDDEEDSSVEEILQANDDDDDEDSSAEDILQGNDVFDVKLSDDNVCEFISQFKPKVEMEVRDVIKENALQFLPAKSLARFRCVSKEWDQWIGGPFLAYRQSCSFSELSGFFREYGDGIPTFVSLNHYCYGVPSPSLHFLPESVVIRSSCNGLLLCHGCYGIDNVYYVCNPANKEWKVLPLPSYYHGSDPAIVLAFEPFERNFAAHYQLICAVPVPDQRDQRIICFEIYSSKKDLWCCSDSVCTELQDDSILKDKGYYIKGCAYWVTLMGKVLAFDLETEVCGILCLPSGTAVDGILTQMHGEICYICTQHQLGNAFVIDFYTGINMSAKHSIVICLAPVRFATGNCSVLSYGREVIIILVDGTIYAYHVRDQKVKVISKMENSFTARYLPYVNSLAPVITNTSSEK